MTHESAPTGSASAAAAPSLTADALEVLGTLRPQLYGNVAPNRIHDPLIEPLWTGIRALAAVDAAGAALVDAQGDAILGMTSIVDGLAAASPEASVVLDGFLTKQTQHLGGAILWPEDLPSMGRLFGLRRDRAKDTIRLKEEALAAHTFTADDEVAFVAIDMLWLDGTSLLDVPLLERRRLLDGVLVESDVVRVGAFVRPPIETWVTSWRSQGFTGLTYKAANSRYLPGEPNPEWVVAGMLRR
jgi:hypothetical protein